jgi:hypothetical protein
MKLIDTQSGKKVKVKVKVKVKNFMNLSSIL